MTKMATEGSVAAGLVAGLIEYAASRGAGRERLLAEAGLATAPGDDPDARVPLPAYLALIRCACRQISDPALALRWGADVGMADLSIVGLIMEASGTMGEAFRQLQRYSRLAVSEAGGTSTAPRFELEAEGGTLFMVDTSPPETSIPELTEIAFARLICGPRRFLPEPHVLGVEVSHPRPAHGDVYETVFQCPVTFGAGRNALHLHPDIAGWPVARSPRYVFGVLTDRADALLQAIDTPETMRGRLEHWLVSRLHTGRLGADQAAGSVGVSRPTLYRRLREEGTTYSDVLNGVRRRAAELYLRSGRTSVAETAYLTGFSDAAAFSRAFKRWTGQSPARYRLGTCSADG
ncbi:AraC family transcriptional regulator [Maricaulis sp.]|uniref:AraC family transcriptional regulator n=1 Tax=Maricaulis sp. TaxID=1486257 RepID=UPI00262286EB|nr:AraC family transcriptional regulator [Maricaulis sp.]